jgi:hypothetical protein
MKAIEYFNKEKYDKAVVEFEKVIPFYFTPNLLLQKTLKSHLS